MNYNLKNINRSVELPAKATKLLKAYQKKELEYQKKKVELDQFKAELLTAMEEYGIKQIENDFVKITYFAPTESTIVDSKKLKDAGLYEDYSKKSKKKAYVRLDFKNE